MPPYKRHPRHKAEDDGENGVARHTRARTQAMLSINNIEVVFDGVILVLKGVSVTAQQGQITTLLGANGAGKTTTLKAISGLLNAERGAITSGSIELDGQRLDRMAPHDIVSLGVAQVFEGRRVFEALTVEENLIVGGHTTSSVAAIRQRIDMVFDYFPRLKERRRQQAGYLSGGEQQMLAIGRALISDPKVILFDEPSLGLAPLIVEQIFGIIKRLRDDGGLTILLVEQNASLALELADHAYVMETGRIVLEGPAKELRENSEVREFYLGLNEAGTRRSYREVRRIRRRQRWLA
jgi:branched-chain amino acid transport system ATP-binding protein